MRDAAIDPPRQAARSAARPRSSGAPPLEGMLGEGVGPRGPRPKSRAGGITNAAVAAQRLGGGRALGGSPGRGGHDFVARLQARLPRIRPLRTLTVAAFGIALVGIVTNAMVFQRGHHPAPLLGLGHSVDGQPDASPRTVAAPAQAPVIAPVDPTGTVVPAPAPAPAAAPALPAPIAPQKPAPARHAVAKSHHLDGIGNLLTRTAPAGATHPRPGHPGTRAAEAAGQPASHPATALAHPDANRHVKAIEGKAHPRPHAPNKAQAAAEPAAPRAGTKAE